MHCDKETLVLTLKMQNRTFSRTGLFNWTQPAIDVLHQNEFD